MTRQELLDMAKKLQSEAETMVDDTGDSATTTTGTAPSKEESSEEPVNKEPSEPETNENDEIEETAQIEPQTNGKVTDDVTPSVNTEFEESVDVIETIGVEQVLEANFDQRFATILTQYSELKVEMDKMKVALSEILTRIELVQEVTDKVTTVDHDTLLSESIKLLI